MKAIPQLLIEKATGKKFVVRDTTQDFHTFSGTLSGNDLRSAQSVITSSTGRKFIRFPASFTDLWEELEKGPQKVVQKDIGLIIAKTGVNKNSAVVDGGGGMGALAFALANICKNVTVYEHHRDHLMLLEKNKKLLGMKNVVLRCQDVYQGIAERNLDLITLDLPEPWKAITPAEKSLKAGGHLVAYLPNLTQVQQLISSLAGSEFIVVETVELLERKWKIEGKILRPEFQMLGHTGFLTFCRKRG